ncbi:hypothetical protein EYC80_003804 [Monilinia laxa]|uniref:Uncharacterized protein n=1 Tax=Monilinia laxa TaxID=61186 RepID=A0A5N6KKS6_MONLA|nr:hypothetical protein EYC80_003804 [Monilinia laxa]
MMKKLSFHTTPTDLFSFSNRTQRTSQLNPDQISQGVLGFLSDIHHPTIDPSVQKILNHNSYPSPNHFHISFQPYPTPYATIRINPSILPTIHPSIPKTPYNNKLRRSKILEHYTSNTQSLE